VEDNYYPLATLYMSDAFQYKDGRLMGRHAAGLSYLRAIAEGDYESAGFLVPDKMHNDNFIKAFSQLVLKDKKLRVEIFNYDKLNNSSKYGGLFIHDPQIGNFGLYRSKFGNSSFSIVGITHTTMSMGVINFISDLYSKPAMEWDALICTSPSVKSSIMKIVDYQEEFLKNKFKAKKLPRPQLPIIPLGIHSRDFNFTLSQRDNARKEMGIKEDDVVLIFVGRLSFHAKAHPFAMYKALDYASKTLKKDQKIHLIQAGWFPNDFIENIFIDEAKQVCPDVICHFVDGRVNDIKMNSLAASDIFISLSDNFQETFGITPLEGMASKLPVIVSDWNGYRATVRDGIDGFTIPTTSLEKGDGVEMAYNYLTNLNNYDHYIGYASQTVSVDIDLCSKKIIELILNKELRRKFGDAGRKRAEEVFEWRVITNHYNSLTEELESIRIANKNYNTQNFTEVIDPYNYFDTYSTNKLTKNSIISSNGLKSITNNHYIIGSKTTKLNDNLINFRCEIDIVNSILSTIAEKPLSVGNISLQIGLREEILKKYIILMLKFDLLRL